MVDNSFVRAVEYEYAVKYLECLGIEATPKNISNILTLAPFKNCLIVPTWETSDEVASTFIIYPNYKKSYTKKETPRNKLPSIKDTKNATAKEPEAGKEQKKESKKEQKKEEKKEIKKEVKKGLKKEEKRSEGNKMSVEEIRKKYLYPFGIDSRF